jgi:hypothetical protein
MRGNVAPRLMLRSHMVTAASVVAVLLGSVWLWAEYGTTVFFETVRAGFTACFG